MTLTEVIQKRGQRHLHVKSAVTSRTTQYNVWIEQMISLKLLNLSKIFTLAYSKIDCLIVTTGPY